ncbi:AIR carboxylase family protein [Candidatus Woesearchaeota archaeon]|nr:AIR carboxylase family protein [Candidatus Woesearchaeota archaeon]
MTVLIIAASKSDVEVMEKAAAVLEKSGIKCVIRVCSAHRTPEMLDRIMEEVEHAEIEKERYDAIIAGAGLAAALPGVVAAKTTLPVIGVPLAGAFEGLDALLSIIQMPPGIPVLTTGVDNSEEAAAAAIKIARNTAKKANITTRNSKNQKAVDKAAETLKQLGIPYSCSGKTEKDAINLCFVDINEKHVAATSELAIYCPTTEKEKAADAVKLLQLTRKGIWVGLNRGENAAVAAAEIMGKNSQLKEYRWGMRLRVEEADKEASNA